MRVADMNSKEYEELRRERDKIKHLLSGPVLPRYETILKNKLNEIRETLSNAHREQHNRQRAAVE